MSERIVTDPSQHGWVEEDGKWVWDASGGGAGAGMVISETEPADKVEGMQWLNPTTGLVLFWDDEKWLQMPTTGAAGKDGKDGVDGGIPDAPSDTKQYARQDGGWSEVQASGGGLWTDEGSNTISYSGTVLMSQSDAGDNAVAIGLGSGGGGQGEEAVSIGRDAGFLAQGGFATAVGPYAGVDTQGNHSVAVGYSAGRVKQGENSIAIGRDAGKTNQGANGILISSFGSAVDVNPANHIQLRSPTGSLRYNGSNSWEFFGGSVSGISFRQNGSPVIDAKGLITTLSTLRKATMDETALEGMRDALADAIGGLIENLEHEIATMPAGDES